LFHPDYKALPTAARDRPRDSAEYEQAEPVHVTLSQEAEPFDVFRVAGKDATSAGPTYLEPEPQGSTHPRHGAPAMTGAFRRVDGMIRRGSELHIVSGPDHAAFSTVWQTLRDKGLGVLDDYSSHINVRAWKSHFAGHPTLWVWLDKVKAFSLDCLAAYRKKTSVFLSGCGDGKRPSVVLDVTNLCRGCPVQMLAVRYMNFTLVGFEHCTGITELTLNGFNHGNLEVIRERPRYRILHVAGTTMNPLPYFSRIDCDYLRTGELIGLPEIDLVRLGNVGHLDISNSRAARSIRCGTPLRVRTLQLGHMLNLETVSFNVRTAAVEELGVWICPKLRLETLLRFNRLPSLKRVRFDPGYRTGKTFLRHVRDDLSVTV
jgi:hypothetical protein